MTGAAVAAAGVGAAVSGGVGAASSGKGGKAPKKSLNDLMYENPQYQAAVQQQQNEAATQLARFNQWGPQGSTIWQGNNQVTRLSPEQQNLYSQTTGNQQKAADFLSDQTGQYRDVLRGDISGGDAAQRQHIEDALMARLNPSLERDQASLAQSLANQGLAPGSEAYTNAMLDQSRRVNDARLGVIGQGTQEMLATQSMDLNKRNQVMSESQGLQQQAGDASVPAYSGSSGAINPVNMSQILQNYNRNNQETQIANQNVKQASKNQIGSAAGSLGSGITSGLNKSSTFQNWFK